MSETSLITYSDREMESSLKDLLERILIQLEKYIETKSDLNEIEKELKDYENLTQLVNIIKVVFTNLMLKIDKKVQKLEKNLDPNSSFKSIRTEDEYEKLEQTVIKYEGEIRNHIRLEQQLKLYSESIQTKLDESEATRNELLETTKKVMNNLKRENQKYYEENIKLQSDITYYKQKIQQFEIDQSKKTIEYDQGDQEIQKVNNNSQQIKALINRKPYSKETNKTSSYSEHKLSSQLQESTDYPTQSQGSLKQNYFNILQYGQSHQQQQLLQQQIQQQQEYQKSFHGKHNSISSINDIIQQQIIIKDKKGNLISQNTSKKNSQNSQVQQKLIQQTMQTQPRSRSGSARRNLNQKQKTSILS
ncbi:unnamed protein product [Paramecium pentaurelia]|uniref:Uncharacterized protein n=1 Tax=Paramecium pentaurelia TaxID=43138 RepID=A0A8S1UVY8_9CILI|nr:unnamed protein product [Paramecium pentaurelia]